MSYYFAIIGTQDAPLFEYEFGTSKAGGDGQARFPDPARHMNQFIAHSSLDIVEEIQWASGSMYLKHIDKFLHAYISAFVTAGNVKFVLLHQPLANPALGTTPAAGTNSAAGAAAAAAAAAAANRSSTSSIANNPTSPQAEEAVRQFFAEVYENWVKAIMSPFYRVNMEVRSPVFRQRVAAAGRKYL